MIGFSFHELLQSQDCTEHLWHGDRAASIVICSWSSQSPGFVIDAVLVRSKDEEFVLFGIVAMNYSEVRHARMFHKTQWLAAPLALVISVFDRLLQPYVRLFSISRLVKNLFWKDFKSPSAIRCFICGSFWAEGGPHAVRQFFSGKLNFLPDWVRILPRSRNSCDIHELIIFR